MQPCTSHPTRRNRTHCAVFLLNLKPKHFVFFVHDWTTVVLTCRVTCQSRPALCIVQISARSLSPHYTTHHTVVLRCHAISVLRLCISQCNARCLLVCTKHNCYAVLHVPSKRMNVQHMRDVCAAMFVLLWCIVSIECTSVARARAQRDLCTVLHYSNRSVRFCITRLGQLSSFND